MRFDDSGEGVEGLTRLMPLTPDPGRTEGVRMRCREQLERRTRRLKRTSALAGFTSRVRAPVLVGGFCLLYVAALVATTLRFEGVLP